MLLEIPRKCERSEALDELAQKPILAIILIKTHCLQKVHIYCEWPVRLYKPLYAVLTMLTIPTLRWG